MLDDSIKEIEWVMATLGQLMNEYEMLLRQKQTEFDKRKQQNLEIINNSKNSPIEQLRALISNVIDSDEILQIARLKQSLLVNRIFANSIRVLQNEVMIEVSSLRSKDTSQVSKPEESKKYADLENELRRMKSTMDEEWKPLMDSLKDEIERRSKYLDKNR